MRFIQFIQSNKWNQATVRRVRRAQFCDESQSRLFARTRDCLPYCTRDELPRVVSSPLHWAIQTTEPCCFAKKLAGKSECERRKAPKRRRLDLTKRRSARYIYICMYIPRGPLRRTQSPRDTQQLPYTRLLDTFNRRAQHLSRLPSHSLSTRALSVSTSLMTGRRGNLHERGGR